MEYSFKSRNHWASFDTYRWDRRGEWIGLDLRSERKEAFNRFLREEIVFLGVLDYCCLRVGVNKDKLLLMRQITDIPCRTSIVRKTLRRYAYKEITLEEAYEILSPVIISYSLKK